MLLLLGIVTVGPDAGRVLQVGMTSNSQNKNTMSKEGAGRADDVVIWQLFLLE